MYYVLRRLSSWGFRPWRDGPLVLGGAGLLLAVALLWQAAANSPTSRLALRTPGLPVGSFFAPSQPPTAKAALSAAASPPPSAPPPGQFASGFATQPGASLTQIEPIASDAPKSSFYRYWRLIKLGFR